MKNFCRVAFAVAWAALAWLGAVQRGAAAPEADFPSRPVRLIVTFAPGGGADILARIVADALSERLGQPVIVENRAGANGNIGMEFVARAPADGYTIVFTTAGTWAVNPSLYKSSFDVIKDFAPIMQVTASPGLLVVNPSFQAKTVQELIAMAKAQPGMLDYGSAGIGGFGHVSAVMFTLMTGTEMTHVPYKGAGPAMVGLLGGEVRMLFNDALATMSYVDAKTVRPLAVTTLKRASFLPDLPTLDESGVRGFENSSWAAMAAPAGTPKEVVGRLNREMAAVLAMPAIRQKVAAAGATIVGGTPEQFADYLKAEIAKFERIVREGHISVQ
jgi:tripartite-type tricarboxylate transporter receptor subunit TctC